MTPTQIERAAELQPAASVAAQGECFRCRSTWLGSVCQACGAHQQDDGFTKATPKPAAEASDLSACDPIPLTYAELRRELATAHAENEEQARLLGAGGSREAALMARVEALSREITKLDDLRAKESATNTQLMADQERFVELIKELRDEVAAVDEAAQTDHTKPTALILRNVIEQRDQARRELEELKGREVTCPYPEGTDLYDAWLEAYQKAYQKAGGRVE